jgi:beta-phosphoglucomutase-like phosphatase (HAD superfamily)
MERDGYDATMKAPLSPVAGLLQSFTPSALVLDMDGLMVDSEPLWFEVEQDFARRHGGAWTAAHAHRCVGRGLAAVIVSMGETLGVEVDVARDTAWLVSAFIERVQSLSLKPGCLALLESARGALPIAVASSSPLRLIEAVLRRFDLEPRFDAVISGESVAAPKPAPDIFLHTARRIGIAPERCAVFEDSIAGATAGRAAGMFVIAVPEGSPEGRGFEAVADVIVADLFEAQRAIRIERGAR